MRTGIAYDDVLIPLLRRKVEEKFGHCVTSPSQFALLAETLFLNEDTIRRVWGFRDSGYKHIRRTTIDILCQYIGFADWDDFARSADNLLSSDSQQIADKDAVCMSDLHAGDKLIIAWCPDRICTLEFLGDFKWQVLAVDHSTTLQNGDTFRCGTIAPGNPLFLDDVTRAGVNLGSILIGKANGLQSAQIIRLVKR